MHLAAPLMVAHLARENAENLPHSAAVESAVTNTTPGGRSQVTSWTQQPAPLPCRLSQASDADREQLIAAQLSIESSYVVVFEASANVQRKDRLTITGTTNGVAFTHV